MRRDHDPLRQQALAHVAVAVAVATWGCSNVVIKAVSVTGLIASFYRLLFALPLLWLVALASPTVRRRLDRGWAWGCLVGGLLFSLHQLMFFNGLKFTSVANVAIIAALQPVLVLVVAGPWFGERVGMRETLLSAVAIVGTVIAVLGSAGAPSWSPFGDALAVANLFSFTAYFLWSKRVRQTVGATEYVFGMTTVAAVVITITCIALEQDFTSPSASDWMWLVFLALVPGTTGHFLSIWAHAHIAAFAMSIMFLAVPVLAALGAYAFVDEPLSLQQIVGGAITLGAIAAILAPANRQPAPAAAARSS
jgi:drug/metabolite transporter (DMT)-like permease